MANKEAATKSSGKKLKRQMTRTNRITILLNDSEFKALNKYLNKYDISNRSRLIRETLMMNILKRFDADNPTLFDELPPEEAGGLAPVEPIETTIPFN